MKKLKRKEIKTHIKMSSFISINTKKYIKTDKVTKNKEIHIPEHYFLPSKSLSLSHTIPSPDKKKSRN